jgi:hypothetical protein
MRQMPPLIRWSRSSTILLSGFFLVVGLIVYIWWPLAEEYLAYIDWQGPWWLYVDWLLVGIFLFMSVAIIARADLRTDGLIILVGTLGGLAIEAWGTQTNLWFYYTSERPPLWIIPAWPIASLAIDRISRFLRFLTTKVTGEGDGKTRGSFGLEAAYWLSFISFLGMMLAFVSPTFDKLYTILSSLLCIGLIFSPNDHRYALLTFAAGSGLGYFLEVWGTTRECWTYYTFQTPPLFAVLAHGMASVAFWRAGLLLKSVIRKFSPQRHREHREKLFDSP